MIFRNLRVLLDGYQGLIILQLKCLYVTAGSMLNVSILTFRNRGNPIWLLAHDSTFDPQTFKCNDNRFLNPGF